MEDTESGIIHLDLSKKDTPNKDSVCCPNHIELCTNLSLNLGTPLYTGQPAWSLWCALWKGSTVYAYIHCQTHLANSQVLPDTLGQLTGTARHTRPTHIHCRPTQGCKCVQGVRSNSLGDQEKVNFFWFNQVGVGEGVQAM